MFGGNLGVRFFIFPDDADAFSWLENYNSSQIMIGLVSWVRGRRCSSSTHILQQELLSKRGPWIKNLAKSFHQKSCDDSQPWGIAFLSPKKTPHCHIAVGGLTCWCYIFWGGCQMQATTSFSIRPSTGSTSFIPRIQLAKNRRCSWNFVGNFPEPTLKLCSFWELGWNHGEKPSYHNLTNRLFRRSNVNRNWKRMKHISIHFSPIPELSRTVLVRRIGADSWLR